MYKLFLTLRYLRRGYIAYFAIGAVMLCTAMVLIVMSVMGGFLDQLKSKARGMLGDIIIDNRSFSGFPLYEEFIDEVSGWPEIVQATPVIYSFGLLRFEGTPETHTVRVVGLRLEEVYRVHNFKQSLYYEKYYPGTTHLGAQQQPLVGFDLDAPPVPVRDDAGNLLGEAPVPVLPEQYQKARAQSWEAGIRDTESPQNEWTEICRAAGIPPIVGTYEPVPLGELGPPQLAGPPHPGVIIGRDIIARRLSDGRYHRYWDYPRGCLVTLTLLEVSGGGNVDPVPIKQPMRYVDDSRTGIFDIDSQHVYCDFDLLQELLRMDAAERVNERGETIGTIPARCSQIQVKMRTEVDGRRVDPRELALRLEQSYHDLADQPGLSLDDQMLIQGVQGLTWEQSQAHIIAPVEKERHLVTILFAIISLVSAFLVLCILYMIVLQKTREIGIIKSVGGSAGGVAIVFLAYGAAIGVVGSLLGSILGYYFVTFINDIQQFLTSINPAWQVWDRSVYAFDEIPSTVRSIDMVNVVIAAIVASTAGALLAALRAGFMQPVEALRHE